MNNKFILLVIVLVIAIFGLLIANLGQDDTITISKTVSVEKTGQYCTLDEVALYIKEYHRLPSNYITKKDAHALGWKGGPLNYHISGKSIGGDVFTNRQHILPNSDYAYIECDINANGTSRGAERIVYNTGDYRVYYTQNHYKSFKEVIR